MLSFRGNDRRQDDRRARRLRAAAIQDRLDARRDVCDFRFPTRLAADVVRARQDDDDLRVDLVKLAVVETPQDVFHAVRAPAEVRRVPPEEIRPPVLEQLRIVERAPPADDGVAGEIEIDAPLRLLPQQCRVRELRVGVRTLARNSGGVHQAIGPRDEVLPVRTIRVTAVVLPPGELPLEQSHVHRRHFLRAVIV